MNTNFNYQAVSYIRLSREDGDDMESESITNQRNIIKTFLEEQNIPLLAEFTDDGKSGGNFDRPAFKKMIEFLKLKKANMVVTKDLSRLGRDYIGTGFYIEHFFPENDIRYYAILDHFDTKDSSTMEMTPIKIGINDMYAKDISKKVRSVIHQKQKTGYYTGAIPCYGYKKDPNKKGKIIIDHNPASIIKKIFTWYNSGVGPTEIAYRLTSSRIPTPIENMHINRKNYKHFHIWQTKTIYSILKNEMYIGKLIQGTTENINYKTKKRRKKPSNEWNIVDNHHDAIIDLLTYNTAQKLLKSHTTYSTAKNYLLKKLLYCKECNHTLGIQSRNQSGEKTTICNYYKKFSKYHYCTPHRFSYNEIENIICLNIRNHLINYFETNKKRIIESLSIYINNIETEHSNTHTIKKEIEKLEKQLLLLYQDRLENIIEKDLYLQLKKEKIKQKEILLSKLNLINIQTQDKIKKQNKINEIISDFFNYYPINSNIIHLLIKKIIISEKKTITIYYNFSK